TAPGQYEIVGWGDNELGGLGIPGPELCKGTPCDGKATPIPNQPAEPVALAAGNQFSLAVVKDGSVYAWGRNENGELGRGKIELGEPERGEPCGGETKIPCSCEDEPKIPCSWTPFPVSGLKEVSRVFASLTNAFALFRPGIAAPPVPFTAHEEPRE